jgi:hypothetical protein
MTDVFRTMIVPAAEVALARQIATTVAPVAGVGMWTTPLSSSGQEPATSYVSTGFIAPEWEVLMPLQTWEEVDGVWTQTDAYPGDAVQLLAAIQAADPDTTITLPQLVGLFATCDVTMQDPWVAFQRLGLQIVQVEEVLPA